MIGEYEGYAYIASVSSNTVTLLTYDKMKKLNGFVEKRDFFKKTIDIADSELESLFEIHFWVKYHDNIELEDLWRVDEDRSVGFKCSIEENEVVIDVPHDAKDDSWIQYEKGAAAKKIKIDACDKFYIEKIYLKKNGKQVNHEVERTEVTLNVFKKSMVMNRRVNL